MILITVLLVLLICKGHAGCGDGCARCATALQICLACKNGYWDRNYRCERCPDNCEQCKDSQNCSKCKANFWNTGTYACNKECPGTCDESGCDDFTGQCYKCKPRFYGTSCQQKCELCRDGQCDIYDGQCLNGCTDGYYEDAYNTDRTCRKCFDHCNLCQSQGLCFECDKGFFKESYTNFLNETFILCNACLSACEECNSVGKCTVCKSGTYGPLCQYNCSTPHCQRCDSYYGVGKCTECSTGFRLNGTVCVPHITCPDNCINGCLENGLCAAGCKEGWSGLTCQEKCSSLCQTCDQTNNTLCTRCKGDFFTSSCQSSCSDYCYRLKSGETCRIQDGFCLNGCTDGHWGKACDISCNEGCNSTRCNQTNGFCATCRRIYYGTACENTCSDRCVDNGSSINICNKSDGRCLLGCLRGYIGDECEYTPRASSYFTTLPTSEKSNPQADKPVSTDSRSFLFGIFAGVGITLVSGGTFGLIFYFRRRYMLMSKRDTSLKDKVNTEYENTMFTMREMVPVDENQDKRRSVETGMGSLYRENDQNTSQRVYESLQGEKSDDQHQYNDLIGPNY